MNDLRLFDSNFWRNRIADSLVMPGVTFGPVDRLELTPDGDARNGTYFGLEVKGWLEAQSDLAAANVIVRRVGVALWDTLKELVYTSGSVVVDIHELELLNRQTGEVWIRGIVRWALAPVESHA